MKRRKGNIYRIPRNRELFSDSNEFANIFKSDYRFLSDSCYLSGKLADNYDWNFIVITYFFDSVCEICFDIQSDARVNKLWKTY